MHASWIFFFFPRTIWAHVRVKEFLQETLVTQFLCYREHAQTAILYYHINRNKVVFSFQQSSF